MKRLSFLFFSIFLLSLGVQAGNPKKILNGLYFDGNVKSKLPVGYGELVCDMYSSEELRIKGNFEADKITDAQLTYFPNTSYPDKVNTFKGTITYSIDKAKDYTTLNITLQDGELDGTHINDCPLIIKKNNNDDGNDWSTFKQKGKELTLSGVLPKDFSSFGFKDNDVKESKFIFELLSYRFDNRFSQYTYPTNLLALVYNGSVVFNDGSSIITTVTKPDLHDGNDLQPLGGEVETTLKINDFGSFTYKIEKRGAENDPRADAYIRSVDIKLKDGAKLTWNHGEEATLYYPNNTSFTGGFKFSDVSIGGDGGYTQGIGKFFQKLRTASSSDFEMTHGKWNN